MAAVNQWTGCYEQSWKDVIVPEAFAHPAKMAYGLLSRILTHAQEQGWLAPQSIILDPFGGIGSTGILGAYEGYQVVCVELEQKFVDLAEQNFTLHDNVWQKLGEPRPIILQGDSRQLVEVVQKADCIVGSPPYYEQQTGGGIQKSVSGKSNYPVVGGLARSKKAGRSALGFGYGNQGNTPGQLGAMKAGDLIIGSPPYAESLKGDGTQNETAAESHAKRTDKHAGGPLGQSQRTQGYGSKQNLGNLKSGDLIISSPPWENQEGSMQSKKFKDPEESAKIQSQRCAEGITGGHYATPAARKRAMDKANQQTYGESEGQLGQEQGETFWSAAKTIVEQCYQILRPGGHAIWVCKDFVRKGKRVPFSKDWSRLCESVGFELIHWHKATLVKESKHETLFGHTEVKRKERKSFFRRLAEAKGSPRIDEEDILCMRAI